jgi:predicted homoserine dehydrogenase-like protein
MASIANATVLDEPADGLAFPPCGVDDLAFVLSPRADGGMLERAGMVEVVSSVERDGRLAPRNSCRASVTCGWFCSHNGRKSING